MALYDALVQAMPSPVAELNRAVAVGMAFGPRAALDLVDALEAEGALANYHWLPSVRGDLWPSWAGMQSARAFERAAGMTRNARERELLLARAAQMRTARPDARVQMPSCAPFRCPDEPAPAMAGVPTFDHPDDRRVPTAWSPARRGVDRAHIIRHAFEPHDAFGLGAIESGVERFYRGADHLAPSGGADESR